MSLITFERGKREKLTKNFQYCEWDCKCGCSPTKHDTELSNKMQILRDYVGKPILLTSPYRCPSHNKRVGGGSRSFHMDGKACDFIIEGVNVWEIGKICEAIGFNGIGVYDDGYVHADVRPDSARYFWHNSDDNPVTTFGGADLDIYVDSDNSNSSDDCIKEIKSVLAKYGF